MAQNAKHITKKEEPPLDVEELDSRRLDPRMEGVKGFLENFSTFAAFGLVGGAAIAAVAIIALAMSGGVAISGVTAGTLGVKSIALAITFASSAIAGLVGGAHYAAHKMHHAERVNEMIDEAKDLLKRKHAQGTSKETSRDDDHDRGERETRPRWLEEALTRQPLAHSSHTEKLDHDRNNAEIRPEGYRLH